MVVTQQETLTRSVEDYLKAIYRLSLAAGGPASTTEIARGLDLSPPSVSGMIKRLAEQGLVRHAPYRGVELTAEGRLVALRMVRRHRIIESYLVDRLGYDWDSVHPEAERLEHAVSDELIDRMAAALGHPRFDPHGDPIPEADGTVIQVRNIPLTDVTDGMHVTVRRVNSNDSGHLRYLAEQGLTPGAGVRLLDRQPFQGPIRMEIEGTERVVGHEIASLVLCEGPEGGDHV
jgi:DtxR family Mn-dependent transcriptional regulator